MNRNELLKELRKHSTTKLFLFSLLTLGIYAAHYIKRQTAILNKYLDVTNHISKGFVYTIVILTYITVIMFVPYLFVEEGHPIETVSDVLDKIWLILVLVWGFQARDRMNQLLSTSKGDLYWFHWLWTLLFTPLYFNFKVNKLYKKTAEHNVATLNS
jgi:hypothetical protein